MCQNLRQSHYKFASYNEYYEMCQINILNPVGFCTKEKNTKV